MDLEDKNQSIEVDTRSLEMRAALVPKKAQGTDKNLVLASMKDEVPEIQGWSVVKVLKITLLNDLRAGLKPKLLGPKSSEKMTVWFFFSFEYGVINK